MMAEKPIENIENPMSESCDSWELRISEYNIDEDWEECCETCNNYVDALCEMWGTV